jgi:hypothetical protein
MAVVEVEGRGWWWWWWWAEVEVNERAVNCGRKSKRDRNNTQIARVDQKELGSR